MKRRDFLQLGVTIGAGVSTGTMSMAALSGQQGVFEVSEKSLADLQAALQSGRVTALQLVKLYQRRIRAIDKKLP